MPYFSLCYNTCMSTSTSLRVYLASGIALVTPAFALAQSRMPERIVPCDGVACTCADLATLAQNVINAGIFLAVFLSAVLFAWAGWKIMVGKSLGTSEDIAKGKQVIWNVVIGLVMIIAAWLIVNTIYATLAGGAAAKVWNSICPS